MQQPRLLIFLALISEKSERRRPAISSLHSLCRQDHGSAFVWNARADSLLALKFFFCFALLFIMPLCAVVGRKKHVSAVFPRPYHDKAVHQVNSAKQESKTGRNKGRAPKGYSLHYSRIAKKKRKKSFRTSLCGSSAMVGAGSHDIVYVYISFVMAVIAWH